jgi:hypothetical protein
MPVITTVNGAGNIMSQSFAGFAAIAVASSSPETTSGGLTQAENDALAGRQNDIANFVNAGGGLLGMSSVDFSNPYAYVAALGSFTIGSPSQYDDVTPTAEGLLVGITSGNLDVCC